MSEESKAQELDQPVAPAELTEHQLDEVTGGNGVAPVYQAPPPPPPI